MRYQVQTNAYFFHLFVLGHFWGGGGASLPAAFPGRCNVRKMDSTWPLRHTSVHLLSRQSLTMQAIC
eukprot:4012455-Amphidinium_carterae.1